MAARRPGVSHCPAEPAQAHREGVTGSIWTAPAAIDTAANDESTQYTSFQIAGLLFLRANLKLL
jgi:hypothetical protein